MDQPLKLAAISPKTKTADQFSAYMTKRKQFYNEILNVNYETEVNQKVSFDFRLQFSYVKKSLGKIENLYFQAET